jgi:hypothetical protein
MQYALAADIKIAVRTLRHANKEVSANLNCLSYGAAVVLCKCTPTQPAVIGGVPKGPK